MKKLPDDFEEDARAALRDGCLEDAHALVKAGIALYADHEGLGYLAYLLAPPRRVGDPVPASPAVNLNYDWLAANKNEYRGRWVALRSGELVAVADSYDGIAYQVRTEAGVFVTKV